MKTPLFAKFLENQFTAEEAATLKGGDPGNGNGADPCDQGNGAVAMNNKHCGPIFVTLKYPCDAADSGSPC